MGLKIAEWKGWLKNAPWWVWAALSVKIAVNFLFLFMFIVVVVDTRDLLLSCGSPAAAWDSFWYGRSCE